MKIGLLGGTFDPIHFGHLDIAKYSLEYLELDQILFIPAGLPYLKDNQKLSSPFHRLKMVKLAIEQYPQFEVSDIEIFREGPTYTIDTINQLQSPDHELVLIFGSDVIAQMNKWKNLDLLFDSISIVFINREPKIHKIFHKNVKFIDAPISKISSTEIKKRIANFLSIEDYVPNNVIKYIQTNQLYSQFISE